MNAVISIVGRVQENGEIQVQSVARIHAAAQPMGLQTRWVAQLMDERGNAIARAPLVRVEHYGGCCCGCGGGRKEQDHDSPPFTFKAYVPNVAPGAALRIVGPDKEIWTRQAPSHPPRFVRAAIDVTSTQQMALTWQVESESDVDVWAQWTNDRGERWHGLAVGLLRGEAILPLTGLPAGQVEVRLLAHDGFFTAESEVLVVDLPERAPEVAILYPRNGQTVRVGQPIQVSGNATDTAGNPLSAERLTWTLNGEAIGRGRELWLAPPNAGRHELTLDVDWKEGKARSVVVFNTERDQRPVNPQGR